MDLRVTLEQIVDLLAPRLRPTELAVYLHLFRHTRLKGDLEVLFAAGAPRTSIGVGHRGRPLSRSTVHARLRRLARNGFIEILAVTHNGMQVLVRLPEEIPGLLPPAAEPAAPALAAVDFYTDESNRLRILQREDYRCFYCRRAIDSTNFVIEHVVSRPYGDNSYKNVVAACCSCNNRKGWASAEGHLRALYRQGLLDSGELCRRLHALHRLKNGDLKPAA